MLVNLVLWCVRNVDVSPAKRESHFLSGGSLINPVEGIDALAKKTPGAASQRMCVVPEC